MSPGRANGVAALALGVAAFVATVTVTGLVVWLAAFALGAGARGPWWGNVAMAAYQVGLTAMVNGATFAVGAAPGCLGRRPRPVLVVPAGVLSGVLVTVLQWTGLWMLPLRLLGDGTGSAAALWTASLLPGLLAGLFSTAWVLLVTGRAGSVPTGKEREVL